MASNAPVTPSRSDRHPFPYSGTPQSHRSTSTSSTPPSIPASSSTSNVKPTTAPISLASLLAIHASALNPHAAALDQALSERNQLSSQNSQLWKLIEKQRSGYNQMMKELERVRNERDSLRAKLATGGSSSSGRDKALKPSVSNSAMSASESTSSNNGVDGNAMPVMARHHSDDIANPHNDHHNTPQRYGSHDQPQSPNATSGQPKGVPPPLIVPARSESLPGINTSTSIGAPSAAFTSSSAVSPDSINSAATGNNPQAINQLSPNLRPSHSSSNLHSTSTPLIPGPLFGATLTLAPKQYPPRRSSMLSPGSATLPLPTYPITPGSAVPDSVPIPNSTHNSSAHSSSTSSLNDPPSTLVQPPPPTSLQPPTPTTNPSPLAPTTGYSSMTQTALVPAPGAAQSSLLSPVIESTGSHRESGISLPDEVKRYIATMGESPGHSPALTSSGFTAPQQQSPLAPSSAASQVQAQPPLLPNPFDPVESEFLDMDDGDHDNENENDDEEDDDDEDDEDDDDVDDEGTGGLFQQQHHQQQSRTQPHQQHIQQSPYLQPMQPLMTDGKSPGKSARAAVEDFPLPPSFGGQHVQQGQSPAPHGHMQTQAHAHAQPRAQLQVQGVELQQPQQVPSQQRSRVVDPDIGGSYSPYLSTAPSSSSSTSLMTSSQSQSLLSATTTTTTSSPAFRALPLLGTDLPSTRISVSHSSIRPNDRGKEVLSFIIVVDPGRGKEPWKVEKLYSDVLGLDQRIKASVGKGVGKKIASLPEGKLWRDHAPAKVDQRKVALETYLQTLINLPVKNKDEVIAFFCSDIVRETKKPVHQAGYKEGYLTKRGKNFGGWKTRYFVLQGPVLEYFESRGGTHLGSITITGAQIGRQQRTGDRRESDDEKEYRHAFLIIEAKKVPSGSSARHVLCAESDADRDNWVEVLVRYIMGSYSEEPVAPMGTLSINTSSTVTQSNTSAAQPRSSTSSNAPFSDAAPSPSGGRRNGNRGMSKEDIAKGPAVPISQLAPDPSNMKLFNGPELRPSSPSKSLDPDRQNSGGYDDADQARRPLEKGQPPLDVPLSTSLPTSSPLDAATGFVGTSNQRANSELGHYPDLQEHRDSRQSQGSPERHRPRDQYRGRKSFHPTLNTVASTPNTPKPPDPELAADTPRADAHGKAKISGPLGGTVIPAGYKFGGKDTPESGPSAAERREKAKSRFWGFGKNASADKHPAHVPRAVFGVTLDESLDVAQIANLPAVVFRCIQYLEAKKADQEEGIYRLSGSSAVIKSLKDRFNIEGDVDLLSSDEYWDPHAIAGLLKSFLRELPASILTRELHLLFLSVIDFVDPQERIAELSHLIASLPIANYTLLRALTAHLILIVQNAGINKMTMRNVGIVFSPTLGIPAGVFSLMLGEFNRVFNVDDAGENEQDAGDNLTAAERRNSRQYTDAAADQLLGLSGRILTAPVEEGQSDADSSSVDYESPESTEDSATSARSSPGVDHDNNLETPSTPKASKASHVAASRGLNIAVSNRGNRHSRMMGLPLSPRPMPSPTNPTAHLVSVLSPQTPK